MEAARLGLHDYQLGGLRPGLGLEPWLAGPPLSTLSHALPGFLAHPQTPQHSLVCAPCPGMRRRAGVNVARGVEVHGPLHVRNCLRAPLELRRD